MGTWSDLKGGALVRVQSAYTSLLPTEQQVANFVLKHREKLPNISIQELALQSNTSPSSITRFCKRIGYRGFKEFHRAVIKDIASGASNILEAVDEDDDTETIIKKVCQGNAQSCIETAQILDPENVEKVARLIIDSERVLIFGDGPAAAVAIDLYHKILRLGISCFYIQDRRLQNIQSRVTTCKDIVIGITFSGSSRGTISTLQNAKQNNSYTVAMTNSIGSPITQVADISLCGTTTIKSMITGTIEPRISQLCVVDSLFKVMINIIRDKVTDKLEKTNDAILDDW